MKQNEYGAPLDRNGYAPSIIPGAVEGECFNCQRNGREDPLNRHEIFFGPYREKSKRLGLWVWLCHDACHQGKTGVHGWNRDLDLRLKRIGQRAAMAAYGWSVADFIREFGKNYLGVTA